jgi:hypothetical protein
MVAVMMLVAVLAAQNGDVVDNETLAAALRVARVKSTNLPIAVSNELPADASAGIEGWTTLRADGKGERVFVYGKSDTFRCAKPPYESPNCILKLASVVIHELWHLKNGAEEPPAYDTQIGFLFRAGAPAMMIAEVMTAREAALRRVRHQRSAVIARERTSLIGAVQGADRTN